jgi:amidase
VKPKLILTTSDGGPKNHENALVGLVVIARRLEEEKVVAMLDTISKALGK